MNSHKSILLSLVVLTVLFVLLLGGSAGAAPHGAWVKEPANPVLLPGSEGSWDQNGLRGQSVIKEGSAYKMWYAAFDGDYVRAIGYATSTDGINWIKYEQNPVLERGPAESWDSRLAAGPTVVKAAAGYEMWYWSYNDDNETAIGHATSIDGITWIKDAANPVLTTGPGGSWDGSRIYDPSVVMVGNTYEMWYQGYDMEGNANIGHATSPDGTNWTKDTANPVLETGEPGSCSEGGLRYPSVVYDAGAALYRIWSVGGQSAQRFCYAYSADGANWTQHPANPVLTNGPDGAWDSGQIIAPNVVQSGDTYEMWYIGYGLSKPSMGLAVAQPGGAIAGTISTESTAQLLNTTADEPRIYALDQNLNVVTSITAEADGSYILEDLPDGDYYVEAHLPGYGREYFSNSSDTAGAILVTVTTGETAGGIDLALAPGGSIMGHVYAADGSTTFAEAKVEVMPVGDGRPMTAASAADGIYTVNDLSTGEYEAWAGHSSYLADMETGPINVTQPDVTEPVDFTLTGPYFPLKSAGDRYFYRWSNDVRRPDPIIEQWTLLGLDGDRYSLLTDSEIVDSQFGFEAAADLVSLITYSIYDYDSPFPHGMSSVVTYLVTPYRVFRQPLKIGASWSLIGYQDSLATSELVAIDETVTVTAGEFEDVLRIHTTIEGQDDYLTGVRDAWFAPGIGLIKLVYQHEDGSTTTAELASGPLKAHIYLPLILR